MHIIHFNSIKKFLVSVTILLESLKKKTEKVNCNFRKYCLLPI